MKKIIGLLLILILSVLFLNACNKNTDEVSNKTDTSSICDSDADTSFMKPNPSENEHQELFDAIANAETVYEWFYGLTGQPLKKDGEIIEIGSNQYYEVDLDGVLNRDELFSYLCTYFSENIATELINIKAEDDYLFKDINGKLFCFGGYVCVKPLSVNNSSIVIKERSDKKIIFRLTITATNDYDNKSYTAEHDYVYEKLNDGKWVFADFTLPYHLISDISE